MRLAAFAAILILAIGTPARAAADSWPRDVPTPEGAIRVYEPHFESLDGDTLKSRAAISFKPVGGKAEPVFGAIWITAKVVTDRGADTVRFARIAVTRVRFPNVSEQEAKRLGALVEEQIPKWQTTLSLAGVNAALDRAAEERRAAETMRTDPPRILVSKTPAVLMLIDGEPERRPIEGTSLEQVVNTPFAVIYEPTSKTYFTSNGDFWYRAPEATGPWTSGIAPPTDVLDAAAQAKPQGSAAVESGRDGARPSLGSALPPAIVVSTEPAELLAFDGEPSWAPVMGIGLLNATNTQSDVFLEIASQRFFVLLSGRWFAAASLDGPWSFVAPEALPADFAKIPPAGEREHVLASVAGTPQAETALLEAQVPQTAAIDRRVARVDVDYDGPPRFQRIPGTDVSYAVNSPSQVLEIHGRFFCVDQGVWFTAPDPEGPWDVSEERPIEVEAIPPSSPVYNVRFVYVYESTPEFVYVGYLPGYVGCFPWRRTVFWGTGYYYRPWRGHFFYSRPCTWGFPVLYDPWWGWAYRPVPCTTFLSFGLHWRPTRRSGSIGYHGWYGPSGPLPVYRPPPVVHSPVPVYTPTPHRAPATVAVSGSNGAIRTPPGVAPSNLYRRPTNVGRIVKPAPAATKRSSETPREAPSAWSRARAPDPRDARPRDAARWEPMARDAPARPERMQQDYSRDRGRDVTPAPRVERDESRREPASRSRSEPSGSVDVAEPRRERTRTPDASPRLHAAEPRSRPPAYTRTTPNETPSQAPRPTRQPTVEPRSMEPRSRPPAYESAPARPAPQPRESAGPRRGEPRPPSSWVPPARAPRESPTTPPETRRGNSRSFR